MSGVSQERITGCGGDPATSARLFSAQGERSGKQSGNTQVQQSVKQTNAACWRIHIRPIGHTGCGSAERAGQSDGNGCVGSKRKLAAAARPFQSATPQRDSPGSDKHLGQDAVQLLSHPGTVHEISERLCAPASAFVAGIV